MIGTTNTAIMATRKRIETRIMYVRRPSRSKIRLVFERLLNRREVIATGNSCPAMARTAGSNAAAMYWAPRLWIFRQEDLEARLLPAP